MTTRILNNRTGMGGRLVRLQHGEPVVAYDGDATEYPTGWRSISVTRSDEYLLPEGEFHRDLLVDANGDVWRIERGSAMGSLWPCEEGHEHTHDVPGSLCWHCSQVADTKLSYEVVTLVSAEGFPAQSARPQTRAEVEDWTGGPLLAVGSPEARARAHEQRASTPTPGGGCPMALAVYALAVAVLVLAVIAVVRLVA